MWVLTAENLVRFQPKSRFGLKTAAGLFFLSWASFPALWILGSPGLNQISPSIDTILHCVADFFSKNLFGLAAWHVRWYGVEDGKGGGSKYANNAEAFRQSLRKNMNGKNSNFSFTFIFRFN